jgi:hypothetical protein
MPDWIFIKKNPTSQMLDGYTYADSALSALLAAIILEGQSYRCGQNT